MILLGFVRCMLIPYRVDKLFFRRYLEAVHQARLKRGAVREQVWLVIIMYAYLAAHLLYYLKWPSQEIFAEFSHIDFIALFVEPMSHSAMYYAIFIAQLFMLIYFWYMIYLRPDEISVDVLDYVFYGHHLKNQLHCLIEPKFRGKEVIAYLRNVGFTILQFVHPFVLLLDAAIIYLHTYFALQLIRGVISARALFSTWNGGTALILHVLHTLMTDFLLLCFGHICILLAALGMVNHSYLEVRVRQNIALLRRFESWNSITLFQSQSVGTLQLIARSNSVYAKLLMVFLIINLPSAAALLINLVLNRGRLNLLSMILNLGMLGEQFLCIIVIHFHIASWITLFHSSSKPLLSLMTKHKGNLRTRLQLVRLVECYHTKRRYGIKYASIALVTMSSFVKLVLLQSEFIMYSYTMLTETKH